MSLIYDLTACGIKPDADAPQTHAIQKVLDFCKENGGTVVFPKGTYRVSGLLLYSDTTVLLKSGAVLLGSENCDDYTVFDVPENVSLRTDQELIPQYFGNKKRAEYRRAMLSAYGARNISIIGEPGSVIDGQNCFDPDGEESKLHYTDDLKEAVSEADVVICLTKTFSLDAMAPGNDQYAGISSLIADAHAAGAKAVLLSDNLPYDASRYQDTDAILLAYMGSGLDMDPTARADGSANLQAYNANVSAAIRILFGDGSPQGKLPVNIPVIGVQEDGSLAYTDEILYERGFGLTYGNK